MRRTRRRSAFVMFWLPVGLTVAWLAFVALLSVTACRREQKAPVASQESGPPPVSSAPSVAQVPTVAVPEQLPADVMAHAGKPTARRAMGFASMPETVSPPVSFASALPATVTDTTGGDAVIARAMMTGASLAALEMVMGSAVTVVPTVGADPNPAVVERYYAWIGANRRRISEAPICWRCPVRAKLEFGCVATRRPDTCKLAERVTLVVNGRVELAEDVAAGECDLWFSADFERVDGRLPVLAGQLRGSSGWVIGCASVTARTVLQ